MSEVAAGSLSSGEPVRVGPFRLTARLSESSAGIVFLGEDDAGNRASVAVLNRGAAQDAAARDRFRAAIARGLPGAGVPGVPGPPVPLVDPPGGGARVVAAQPDGAAPWVATVYEPDREGAERFLEPVRLHGAGYRHGPGFVPHWTGSDQPALPERPRMPLLPGRGGERSLVAAVVTLVAVLMVLGLLLAVLFACGPEREPEPEQQPVPTQEPQFPPPPPLPSPSPSPSESSPGPSPSEEPSGELPGQDGGPL